MIVMFRVRVEGGKTTALRLHYKKRTTSVRNKYWLQRCWCSWSMGWYRTSAPIKKTPEVFGLGSGPTDSPRNTLDLVKREPNFAETCFCSAISAAAGQKWLFCHQTKHNTTDLFHYCFLVRDIAVLLLHPS